MLLSARQRQELVNYLLDSQKQQKNPADSPFAISETNRGPTVIDEPFTEIRMGDLYFCQEQRLVYIGEQVIKLTAKEFDILALLITHPKRVFTYGIRLIGNRNAMISNIWIPAHILGKKDNEKIAKISREGIEGVMAFELIDFTVAEYIRDAGMLGKNKAIISMGHFNGEELGMRYMAEYLQELFCGLPICFIACGDMYDYI